MYLQIYSVLPHDIIISMNTIGDILYNDDTLIRIDAIYYILAYPVRIRDFTTNKQPPIQLDMLSCSIYYMI